MYGARLSGMFTARVHNRNTEGVGQLWRHGVGEKKEVAGIIS
jgi:hypothetical protein